MKLYKKICFGNKLLIYYPYPPAPFPWERGILLGLPPLDPVGGYAPATPFLIAKSFFDKLKAVSIFL